MDVRKECMVNTVVSVTHNEEARTALAKARAQQIENIYGKSFDIEVELANLQRLFELAGDTTKIQYMPVRSSSEIQTILKTNTHDVIIGLRGGQDETPHIMHVTDHMGFGVFYNPCGEVLSKDRIAIEIMMHSIIDMFLHTK